MKLIIAGSRTITLEPDTIYNLMDYFKIKPSRVICGMAKGVDKSGYIWAHCAALEVDEFPADWNTYGKSAGYIRNKAMADYADALLLIWDGESRGSANMKSLMEKLNKPIYEVVLKRIINEII